jgi:hypothetical protein
MSAAHAEALPVQQPLPIKAQGYGQLLRRAFGAQLVGLAAIAPLSLLMGLLMSNYLKGPTPLTRGTALLMGPGAATVGLIWVLSVGTFMYSGREEWLSERGVITITALTLFVPLITLPLTFAYPLLLQRQGAARPRMRVAVGAVLFACAVNAAIAIAVLAAG